ncbi:MAG: sensor domain-containing diguanylate cyclase [Anaerolineae bacterium]|nr:sensor domain-containing diguanylate cyclase [Anaerolineae bacterium]
MTTPDEREHFQTLFEYAPVSLWEEDYSGIKRLFDALRLQGVESLEAYLDQAPDFVDACMRQMAVLRVNQQTLEMLKAVSQDELLSNLDKVFRDGMRHHFRSELLALWNGDLAWAGEGINYALDGEAIDILLHWRILPGFEQSWERVLVTIENITARKQAERRLQRLFDASPISLWEEDYSALKQYFDTLRKTGVVDLQSYFAEHPAAVSHCMSLIRVLDVNQRTLDLFGAASKEQLLSNLDKVFRDEMGIHFARELVDLWNGKLSYERDGINYSLNGEPVSIHLNFKVMPGHEHDFSWVLVAIEDITARKKAEDYLRYLGTHDVMTGLYNRTYFEETVLRLEKERRDPLSVLIADVDGLKKVNDSLGHQAGDSLIRRAAEVIKAALGEGIVAARIGGDEFTAFLPDADQEAAEEAIRQILSLVELNNKYYREPLLSISLGAATSQPGLSVETVIRMADDAMYGRKGEHYHRRQGER